MVRTRLRLGASITAMGLVAIFLATLTPAPDQARLVAKLPTWCLVCGDLGGVDVTLNVLLFIPFGIGLTLAGVRWRRVILIAAVTSGCIELLQYSAIVGRDASLSDFLTNTLGGALGALIANTARTWLTPRSAPARRLAAAAALVWIAQAVVTAYALTPSLPRSVYWGQHAPDLEQFERFRGQVVSADIGPAEIPEGRLRNSARVRALLLDSATFQAIAVPAGPTPGLAPVASIFDGDKNEIALLGQDGVDLVFRLRTHAVDLRLRPPALRVASAFAAGPADTVRMSGVLVGNRLVARVSAGSATREAARALSPQWGWSLLLPFHHAFGADTAWVTALWIAAWLAVLGYWTRQGWTAPASAALVLLATAVAGLVVVPWVFGFEPAPFTQWLGAVCGAAIGWGAGAWMARSGRRLLRAIDRADYAIDPPSARSAASP
ncbi:MAG TPA: VanZ family protein [Gemmatimonadales bacterium]|nr:VanZ family protein [Gemmatimonadales bacterium]